MIFKGLTCCIWSFPHNYFKLLNIVNNYVRVISGICTTCLYQILFLLDRTLSIKLANQLLSLILMKRSIIQLQNVFWNKDALIVISMWCSVKRALTLLNPKFATPFELAFFELSLFLLGTVNWCCLGNRGAPLATDLQFTAQWKGFGKINEQAPSSDIFVNFTLTSRHKRVPEL